MLRDDLAAFIAFAPVAGERSFTRGAAKLGVTPSALRHTIRRIEERLGMRVLARTTRSVSLTEAGERLLNSVSPHLKDIVSELAALTELRDIPAGTIRINAGEHAVRTVIWPRLDPFVARYPDIKLEVFFVFGFFVFVVGCFVVGVWFGVFV